MADWERLAFLADGEAYTLQQVADDARRRGTWAPLVRTTAAGLAAIEGARLAGLSSSRDRTREAEAAWRHARRLVAGEDLETWLAARKVTVREWRSWVRAELAIGMWPELAASAASDPDERGNVIWAAGWCSGTFERLARDLAALVAARLHVADGGAEPPLEHALERFTTEAVTEEAVRLSISSNQLDWLAIEGDWLSFPDEDVASEGLAFLRDDGLTIEALAALLGIDPERRRIMVEDVPVGLRQCFLSAQVGEHLGPIAAHDGVAIVAVRAKILPSADDRTVRERATATIIARAIERAIEERVTWVEPF